ncbi:MAG TPA: lamin tail domain-containing protein [Polyangiaceae bacterium]|nr:lamin tail domain-containing protein [Polyangiaceae bacterium]
MPRFFALALPLLAAFVALSGCSSDEAPAAAVGNPSMTVAFNEISAAGDEWLELYNTGSSEFDLSNYAIADSDETTGEPRIDKAMRFPAGTKLPKGGFVLVLLGKTNSTPGPYAAGACLPGVAVGCFYALFSVSQARGESVHLLAPDNTSVVSMIYPADLAFEAGVQLSACRLPDGTGGFATCAQTPGAANIAP